MSHRLPEFEVEESEDYREIHVDGVFGGLNPSGAKVVLLTDKQKPKMKRGGKPGQMELDKIVRETQAELHMSPIQFKSVVKWMTQKLKQYEDRFGEIKLEKEGKGEGPTPTGYK